MTSEELFLLDKNLSENQDDVIISFGPINGIKKYQVDSCMFEFVRSNHSE